MADGRAHGSGLVGLAWALALALGSGCTGEIDRSETTFSPADGPRDGRSPGSEEAETSGSPGNGERQGTAGSSGGPGGAARDDGLPPDVPAPATRAARLTHAQWENSVQDLLRLSEQEREAHSFASGLLPDPVQSGFLFDNNTLALEVSDALFLGYQRAAASVAEFVTSDSARLAKILPPDTGDDEARARAFIERFGRRAHRRPLTDAQVDDYSTLYAMAPSLYPDDTPFEAGVRLLIEAFLQSPYFLYRLELSDQEVDGSIPLDSYEIAQRLSYTLWNTMPDEALFDGAADDLWTDPTEVAAQARRMLEDPRAADTVYRFHARLFEVEDFLEISPAEAFYPDAPEELGEYAMQEHELFVRDVFAEQGGYRELLTSTDTFVNAELADIYGLSGSFGADFEEASLDAMQRKGILTQVGFLAANATTVNPDPIHRGVFIAERVNCTSISAPPADIPPLPDPAGRTNRQLVEDHTQNPDTVCVNCHGTIINPLGFPFESFDAIGQFRTEDDGQPVDTRAEALVGNERVEVRDALDLVDAIADSDAVHECYAKHWVEFAYGRPEADEDEGLITRLGQGSREGTLSIEDLVVELVTSEAFLTRSPHELESTP